MGWQDDPIVSGGDWQSDPIVSGGKASPGVRQADIDQATATMQGPLPPPDLPPISGGEGDGFLAKVNAVLAGGQRYASEIPSGAELTRIGRENTPAWTEAPAQAVSELVGGMVPHDLPSYFESLYPPAAAGRLGYNLAHGDVSGLPFAGRVPELIAAEETPGFSKERYLAGIKTLMDVGLLAGIGGNRIPSRAGLPEGPVQAPGGPYIAPEARLGYKGPGTITEDVRRALERRIVPGEGAGQWVMGPDGRPVPVVPTPPEAPPQFASPPSVEDILSATQPRVSPETGFTHFPGPEAPPQIPMPSETARWHQAVQTEMQPALAQEYLFKKNGQEVPEEISKTIKAGKEKLKRGYQPPPVLPEEPATDIQAGGNIPQPFGKFDQIQDPVGKATEIVLEPPGSVLAKLSFGNEAKVGEIPSFTSRTTSRGKQYNFSLSEYDLPDGRKRFTISAGGDLVDAGALVKLTPKGPEIQMLHAGQTGFEGLGGALTKEIAKRYGRPIVPQDAPLSSVTKRFAVQPPEGPLQVPQMPVNAPEAPVPAQVAIPPEERAYAGLQPEPPPVQKPSKIGKSIEAKAVEAKLTQGFAETAGYDPITIGEQSQMATDLIKENPSHAGAIIRGEAPLPPRLRGTSLITAMEEHLLEHPSAQGAYELANSPLTSATSAAAQEMRLMSERVPDSLSAKFADIKAARKAGAESRGETPAKIKRDISKEIVRSASKRPTWADFVREIEC